MESRNTILFVCMFFLLFPILFGGCGFRKSAESQEAASLDRLVLELEDCTSKEPEWVCSSVDSLLPSVKDSILYYRLVVLKAKSKLFLAELDSSDALLREAEVFCVRHASDESANRLCARVFNMRGNVYGRFAVYDSAVWAFEKAFGYASREGASGPLLNICVNLADAYVRRGRYDLCSYWYNYALSVADSIDLPDEERFPVYYGLAQVNMELRDFALCDYYYERAARYYDKMEPYEQHIYLNNRGNSYYYRQDYGEALKYFRRSLALTEAHNMEFERNLTMVNLGEVFMLQDRTDSAAYYLHRCHRFFSSVNNASALYYIDTQLIELALKQGDIGRAKRMLRLTKNTDNIEPNMIRIRNRYLEHYFEATGDYRNAYKYQNLNWNMDDSIRNERVKMRAAELALKYKRDSTLMKQELFIKQKENEVLELRQWIWLIVGIVSLLAVAAAAGILYRKRLREKELWTQQTAITSLRLENIRNRISPHFIFNVLNREASQHKGDSESRNLLELARMLRRNLELTDKMAVSLADELDFVNTYVRLEEASLGEGFEFRLSVDDRIRADEVMIPAMLLQIPAENAIKHGLRMKEGKRLLHISVEKGDGGVVLCVRDNGGGYRVGSANHGTGTGMKVITQTIQLLNFYNSRPMAMKINNVAVGDDGNMGCEVRYVVPSGYSYTLKKRGYE